jgi:hypothetical protein
MTDPPAALNVVDPSMKEELVYKIGVPPPPLRTPPKKILDAIVDFRIEVMPPVNDKEKFTGFAVNDVPTREKYTLGRFELSLPTAVK